MSVLTAQMSAFAISALARLGVPDHLASGPKTAAELGDLVHADPDRLERLMRATEGLGFLTRSSNGQWAQTSLSAVLRSDSTDTLRDLAVFFADEWRVRGFASLDETVRGGQTAFHRLYGMDPFEYLRAHPQAGETFNRAMTSFSSMDAPAVAEAYDFTGIDALTDVGGGQGSLLATILTRYPQMTGTLYELPQVLQGLNGQLQSQFPNRVRFLEGDMFQSIPPGADAYIMKRIIHDWPDADCIKILTGCRAGVASRGRLLVVDAVVPAGPAFSPAKIMDLTMMLFSGGKERTAEEFRQLFAASGWRLNRIIPTASQLSVMEGLPA